MFYLFRFVHRESQAWNHETSNSSLKFILDLLNRPPETPEYSRLFAIDTFNLIAKITKMTALTACLASTTGRLMSSFSLSDHIWCAARQRKPEACQMILLKAFQDNSAIFQEGSIPLHYLAYLVIIGLVESGQETHFGLSVIERLLLCKDSGMIIKLCRDMDLEDCTEIRHRKSHAEEEMGESAH